MLPLDRPWRQGCSFALDFLLKEQECFITICSSLNQFCKIKKKSRKDPFVDIIKSTSVDEWGEWGSLLLCSLVSFFRLKPVVDYCN